MKFSRIFRFLLLVLGLTVGLSAVGQRRKIQNKPFIDTRRWHYGFNIGFHDQGLHLVGNGYTDEAGFCFIGYAGMNDKKILTLVYGGGVENRFADTKKLMDLGFDMYDENYDYYSVAE